MSQLARAIRAAAITSGVGGNIDVPSGTPRWTELAPAEGQDLVISDTVVFDAKMAYSVGFVTIAAGGHLIVSTSIDTWLRAKGIRVQSGGAYTSGSSSLPNMRKHRRTLTGPAVVGAVRGLAFDGPSLGTSTTTGNNALGNDNFGVSRGLLVDSGGRYEIYGHVPTVIKTFLSGHHYAGATTLTFADVVEGSFVSGDEIAIAPTGFYRPDRRTEKFIVSQVAGNTVTILGGLGYDRWGLMQYLTNTGISTTPGAYTLSDWQQQSGQWVNLGGKKWGANAHTQLDQRARVVLLTRRHVADSPADADKTTYRHGHHDMYMLKPGDGGKVALYGLEARAAGQGGLLGRYPFHFHANSIIPNTATNLGPLDDGQAQMHSCVVNSSFNRGFTFHACRNVKNQDFTSFDTKGHAIFFESGAEMGNSLIAPDVYKWDDPGDGWRILAADGTPAGLWCTNLSNHIVRGRYADGIFGGWITLTEAASVGGINGNRQPDSVGGCFGIARLQAIYPALTPPLEWVDNEWHSVLAFGKNANSTMVNERGDTSGSGTGYFNAEGVPGGPTYVMPTFEGDRMWKCNQRGYINEFGQPHYLRQFSADNGANQETFDLNGDLLYIGAPFNGFATATQAEPYLSDPRVNATNATKGHLIGNDFSGRTNSSGAVADGMTMVDTSLNNWDSSTALYRQRVAFDSYHFTLTFKNVTAFGYQVEAPPVFEAAFRNVLKTRAVLGSWDLYLNGIEFASRSQPNWNLVNNAGPAMYVAPGPGISAEAPWVDWLFPGAIPEPGRIHNHCASVLDYYGTLFNHGSNIYGGPDHPFVTYGDANVFDIKTHDLSYIAMAGTTTKRIGLNSGTGNWFDAAGVDQWTETFTYQRGDAATFADYLAADTHGRYARWRNIGMADAGINPPDIGSFSGRGGGGNHASVPAGAVVRVYNPNTPTNLATIHTALRFTDSDGTANIYYGFAMDTSKTISGNFAAVTFAPMSSLAALKASSVSALWKDTAARTGAPNGVVWCKCWLPVADGSADSDWYIDQPLNLTAI